MDTETLLNGDRRLVMVVQELSRARSVERIAEIVRREARKFAGADGATFVLRDGNQCHYFDEEAIAPLWKGHRFPMEACISGWSMIHGESVAIPDIYKDSRIPVAAYRPTFVKSLLMTPVRQKEAIAAIGVYWSKEHHPAPEEIEILAALANSTAIAMMNVRLQTALIDKVKELERASELKDQFLLMLSHELRTPMNSILGWSDLLKDNESIPPGLRAGADAIYRNAQSEMRLIGDLLDTTQIMAGQLSISKDTINIGELVSEVVRAQRLEFAKKGIHLIIREMTTDLEVQGDCDRLKQVMSNLLSNALKFTAEGGEVRVEMSSARDSLVIAVQDNGEGIASELLPKVFDRFQSQSGELTRRHGGLGLGLTIVKSLVEAHGGQVTALSHGPGQGARFEVKLPHLQAVQPSSNLRLGGDQARF